MPLCCGIPGHLYFTAADMLLGCYAAEMFARQLLARVAFRLGEELQQPPRRLGQPQAAGPQWYSTYITDIDSAYATPFWFLVPPPLLLLGELARQSRSGGQHGRNMNNDQQ